MSVWKFAYKHSSAIKMCLPVEQNSQANDFAELLDG